MEKRYFASLDKKTLFQISSKGGKRTSELGTAHRFTKEEARVAGLKGLQVRYKKNVHSKEQVDNSKEAGI